MKPKEVESTVTEVPFQHLGLRFRFSAMQFRVESSEVEYFFRRTS